MRAELMTDVRRMLVSLGWTNHNADLLPDGLNLSPSPIQLQTPGEWKAAMSNKRAEILEERACNLPPNAGLDTAALSSSSFVPNDVHVVDKSYMSRLKMFPRGLTKNRIGCFVSWPTMHVVQIPTN